MTAVPDAAAMPAQQSDYDTEKADRKEEVHERQIKQIYAGALGGRSVCKIYAGSGSFLHSVRFFSQNRYRRRNSGYAGIYTDYLYLLQNPVQKCFRTLRGKSEISGLYTEYQELF